MEVEANPGSGVVEEEISEVKVDGKVQEILINGDENLQGQDGIKHSDKDIPHPANQNLLFSANDLFEAHDKIRDLELQLKTVHEELQNFDSDRAKLKLELDLANEKLRLISTQYEDLLLEHKRMREEMSAEGQKYNLQGASLLEALKDLDRKHLEFSVTKEALDGLTTEFENSKKKFKELELQLEETANQACKFEQLSNERSSHAESQSQRALELEKMLETAKLSSTEMQHHVNKLQEELRAVSLKLEERNQVEEILGLTKKELTESMERLNDLNSHIVKLEQLLSSKEASVSQLTQELNFYKNFEDEMQQEKLVFESNLSSMKEDLQIKIAALEEGTLKLEQEIKTREMVQNKLQDLELQNLGLQEDFLKLNGVNETLQIKLADLSTSENEFKAKLLETETQLVSTEKKNIDLKLQMSLVEQKCADTEKELKLLGEKSEELNALLRGAEENHNQSLHHIQAYQDRVTQLELSLNLSYSKKSEVEQELTNLAEKCALLEEQISVSHQRGLELHDLIHVSESKVENTERKVTELELFLEAAKHEKEEMEQQLKLAEGKCKEAEAELEKQVRRVLEISMELQELKDSSQQLVEELESANDKEKELIYMLNSVTEESKKHEGLSNSSAGKLLQAEKLIEELQFYLKVSQEKLAIAERDLEVSGMKEKELAENIKSTEEQLEHERKSAEQSVTKCLELESLHDFFVKDSERKLEAAVASFSEKDSEAKHLYNRVNSLEEQAAFYQEQVMVTTEKLASLMMDLDASAAKLSIHETTIQELTEKFSDSVSKAEKNFTENVRVKKELEESDSKIKELYETLSSIHSEKEAMDNQLLSYLQSITDLTNERSRNSEYQSQIEASIKETEAKLCEALEKCVQKDSETRELNDKLLAFETQLKAHEEHANEAAIIAESHKAELEDVMFKIQSLEQLVEETKSRATYFENQHEDLAKKNLCLSQRITKYETEMVVLEGLLKTITVEKEDSSVQLQSSYKAIEDLSQQLVSERTKFQSQISSSMNDNNRINKLYQDAKEEIEEVKDRLQEMQNAYQKTESAFNADQENLKLELSQKSQLQAIISELEQKLSAADTKHKEEILSLLDETNRTNEMYQDAKKEMDAVKVQFQDMQSMWKTTECSLNTDLENLQVEVSQKSQLQAKISELQLQLSVADTKYREEIENMRQAVAEKETLLAAKVQEHASLVQIKDVLNHQLEDLQKEYILSQKSLFTEQKESSLRMQQEREYVVISSHDELEAEQQRSSLLEKQIEELKLKLETVQTKDQKAGDDRITEDNFRGVEGKSRDFELPMKLPYKRKGKKKGVEKDSASSSGAPILENSGINSLKFFLGVVAVSLFIGVFLGKKY